LHKDRTTSTGTRQDKQEPGLSVRNNAYGDSCFRLARRSHHSRSAHFIPAGGATRRLDFEDRFLGPKCSPYSGTACPAPHSGVRGTRSQIVGCFLGPKSGPPNQASRRGVRQRFSCPVSRSKSSSPAPTPSSFHTRRRRCVDRRPHQRNMKRQWVPHDQAHTPASQAAQSQSSRREAESSLHEALASRQQATSRGPQAADKMPSAGSGSNNACPSASNMTLQEKSQPCSQQAISWPAAIRGSRTRQQQAAPSSNTHSKQQASSRRPAGKRQATKTTTMNGRGEHRYHALQQCSASLGGGGDPFFAILRTATCSCSARFGSVPSSFRSKRTF
jgi:hypothetical protein